MIEYERLLMHVLGHVNLGLPDVCAFELTLQRLFSVDYAHPIRLHPTPLHPILSCHSVPLPILLHLPYLSHVVKPFIALHHIAPRRIIS